MSGPTPSGLPDLSALGAFQPTERLKRFVTAYMVGGAALEVCRRLHRSARAQIAYTATVLSSDDLFVPLQVELYARLSGRARRAVTLRSRPTQRPDLPVDAAAPDMDVTALYDATREHRFRHDGQTIRVTIRRPDEGKVVVLDRYAASTERAELVFTAYGTRGRDAIGTFVADVAAAQAKVRAPHLHVATAWGEWLRRDELTDRPLDSVILPAAQKARIVDDLEKFRHARPDYDRLGIPWHRGYLFAGPPGTGKTSMARALACRFGLDVYYLPVAAIADDMALFRMLAQIGPDALLVLEDVDILHAATSRDDAQQGVTLGGLLNALDGFVTPEGLVTVMTTNKREALDDALFRPGRVDVDEKFGWFTGRQADEMRARFGVGARNDPDEWVAPAALAEQLKRTL